jgi:uncharacterized membrane protein YfcA
MPKQMTYNLAGTHLAERRSSCVNAIQAALALLIGLAGGVVSGFFGIGGAVVIVPALVYLMRMEQHKAQGTSLGALLLPVGLLGFLEYYRNGEADIKVAALVAIRLFIGAFIDAYLAQLLSPTIMRRAFGLLLVAIGLSMVLRSA